MSIQNDTSPNRISWHIGQKVWHWSSTKEALLLVLIPVAVALITSALLPQIPAWLRADELKNQEWLAVQQDRFKNWTPVLTAIGAFHIRETLWFRVLLTLLTFVLLVALGEQARILFNPVSIRSKSRFYDTSETEPMSSSLPYDQVVQHIQQSLPRPLVQTDEQNHTYLYARLHTWAKASTTLCYLGLLLLVSSLAIQTRWGWRQSEIQVLPYTEIALGPDDALQLLLLDSPPASDNGQTVQANLRIAAQTVLPIQLGVPIRHRGYRYLWVQRGGPSVRLHAHRVSTSEQAQTLTLYDYAARPQPVQSLQFNFVPGQEQYRQFILSEDKLVGWLLWNDEQFETGDGQPAFYLWVFSEDGQELGVEAFQEVESEPDTTTLRAVVGDVTYLLEVAQYIVLDIAHQPGLWVAWLGSILLAVGCAGMLVPQQQIWLKAAAENDRVVVQIREQRQGLIPAKKTWDNTLSQLRDALQISTLVQDDTTHKQASTVPSGQNPAAHRKTP